MEHGYYNTRAISDTKFFEKILPSAISLAIEMDEAQQLLLFTSNRDEAHSLLNRIGDAFNEYEKNGFEGAPVTYMPLWAHADDALRVEDGSSEDEYLVNYQNKQFVMKKKDFLKFQENRLHPELQFQDSLPQGGVGLALFRYGLEPDDDMTIDHPQYRRLVDCLTADRGKAYPHWCVIGVIEQDSPLIDANLLLILKKPSAYTVFSETV